MISCPEELAYRLEYIKREQLSALANQLTDNDYSVYLRRLLDEEIEPIWIDK